LARLTPFAVPEGSADVFDAGARLGRNFTPERADSTINVFESVVAWLEHNGYTRSSTVREPG